MPLFYYEAISDDGDHVRGTVEAISAQAARAALRQDHLEAEELHEATLAERRELEGYMPAQPSREEASVRPTPVPPEKSHKILEKEKSEPVPKQAKAYYPFIDTLRLYAGWLLAWYCLVYAIGGYQYNKRIFLHVPYVEALLPPFSSIVFSFTLASFLFLLLTSIHKIMGGTKLRTFGLVLLGVAAFALYRINV